MRASESSFIATTKDNKKINLFDDDDDMLFSTAIARDDAKSRSMAVETKKRRRKLKATVEAADLDGDGESVPNFKRPAAKSTLAFNGTVSPPKPRNAAVRSIFRV
jgi:hypothetical protein